MGFGEKRRVSAAARDKSAKREELTGSTITITSLGRMGGVVITPVARFFLMAVRRAEISTEFDLPANNSAVTMTTIKNKKRNFHDQLLTLIGKVDRPGTFCCGGDRPLTMPGLQVDGLGAVGLPLGGAQAAKLIKLCHQAPYGKGTDTLVDTKVRRAWELDSDQFQLTNPNWDQLLAGIVADVQRELGLADRKLTPHLYKLVVYEPGGFFLPHRDGEKLDAMVATLVIGLPSVHEGGELVVSHHGKQQTLTMAGAATGVRTELCRFLR